MGYHKPVSASGNPKQNLPTISNVDPGLRRSSRLGFEQRLTLLAVFAGLPGVALSLLLLWLNGYSARLQWTVGIILVIAWLSVTLNLKQRVVRPLQTLANILAALHEGDYSIRARRAGSGDALSEVLLEANELGTTLRNQRLGALEATA